MMSYIVALFWNFSASEMTTFLKLKPEFFSALLGVVNIFIPKLLKVASFYWPQGFRKKTFLFGKRYGFCKALGGSPMLQTSTGGFGGAGMASRPPWPALGTK